MVDECLLSLITLQIVPCESGASFAENFYGLKRRRTPAVETVRVNAALNEISPHEKLQSRDINRSLFFLVSIGRESFQHR
jgi:hypothetical protein